MLKMPFGVNWSPKYTQYVDSCGVYVGCSIRDIKSHHTTDGVQDSNPSSLITFILEIPVYGFRTLL